MNKKDQLACQTLAYHALNQDGVSLAKTTHFPGERRQNASIRTLPMWMWWRA